MARSLQPGTPSRSPRYVIPIPSGRLTMWSLAAVGSALAVGLALFFFGVPTLASPGHVAAAHSAIDGRCAECHQPAKAVAEVRCERCHDPIDARRFGTPAHAALGGSAVNAAHVATVECAACHDEHRGRTAELARVDDRRCTSCHTFGSFGRHPEIAVVRAKQAPDPGLDFSHEAHLKEVAKLSGDRCGVCHVQTADQRGFEPISFDAHCAKCHIKDGKLTMNGTDLLASLPTPADLLPSAAAGLVMPAVSARDERNGVARVTLTDFAHRDRWMLAAADEITRMMDTPGLAFERARLVEQIARVSAVAQATPIAGLGDADLDRLAASLTEEIGALDRQMAAGPSAGANESAALQSLASTIDPSLTPMTAELGAASAPPATTAPADAQQIEANRRELAALLDAIQSRTDGALAGRAADLRKRLADLKPAAPSTAPLAASDRAALADRLNAVDAALRAVEQAGGPAMAADVQSLRERVAGQLVGGVAGSTRTFERQALLSLIDAIGARGDEAMRARVSELRAAVLALPVGAADSLAQRRDEKARLLQRVDLERTLRRSEGRTATDAITQTERSTAMQELQVLRGRLATFDSRISNAPQLDATRGQSALHNLLDACLKCHRPNAEKTALLPVAASQSLLTAATFTHKPHLLQAKCETCHASIATSKAGVDANMPGIASCQSCHASSEARTDCVACHGYHPRSATEAAMSTWR